MKIGKEYFIDQIDDYYDSDYYEMLIFGNGNKGSEFISIVEKRSPHITISSYVYSSLKDHRSLFKMIYSG